MIIKFIFKMNSSARARTIKNQTNINHSSSNQNKPPPIPISKYRCQQTLLQLQVKKQMLNAKKQMAKAKQNNLKTKAIHAKQKSPQHQMYLYSRTMKQLKEYKYEDYIQKKLTQL